MAHPTALRLTGTSGRAAVALVVLLASAGGCGDPSAPTPLRGTYVLRSIDGQPPGANGNGPSMMPFQMVADTLRVYDDGQGVEVLVTRYPDQPAMRSAQPFTVSPSHGLTAPLAGLPVITLSYPCPDYASCIAPPHHRGRIEGNRFIVEWSAMYRTPLVFERVSGTP